MKVLIAVDGSPTSEAAIREVCRRPWPTGSEFRLITVDPQLEVQLSGERSPFDELLRQQRQEVIRRLDAAAELFRREAPNLTVTPVLGEGWPKDVILNEAEEWGGRPGGRRLARLRSRQTISSGVGLSGRRDECALLRGNRAPAALPRHSNVGGRCVRHWPGNEPIDLRRALGARFDVPACPLPHVTTMDVAVLHEILSRHDHCSSLE